MIRRSTLVMLVVFAALVAFAIFWQRSEKKTEAESTPTAGTKFLFEFSAKITGLRLEKTGVGVVELGRDAQGVWALLYPKAEATDVGAVESAVSQLLSLSVLSDLDEAPSLEAAGLEKPAYRLLIKLDDGSQELMSVGKLTPTGSGYYVLAGNRGLFLVSKYSLEPFLNLVENPPIQPTPTPAEAATPEAPSAAYPEALLTPAP